MFRGPTGQGVAIGSLPLEWGPDRNVAWKQAIPGLGWSSPVVSKGRVFLTTGVLNDDESLSLRTIALDDETGKIVWNVETFRIEPSAVSRMHKKNSHASPTPIIDGDKIVVHFGHYGSATLDWNGKVVWKNNEFRYAPVHGNGGTPVIAGPNLIFSADGGDTQNVIALDRATGKIAWKTPRNTKSKKKFAFSTPLVISVHGMTQVVSPGPGIVAAYEPAKGKEIWRVNYGEGYSVTPRPAFGHGLVFVSSGFDQPVLYAIKPDGRGDVTSSHVAWTLKKGAPHTPSPLVVGDELYLMADNGLASCLDAKTGKIHWQQRIPGAYSASPIVADGKIHFTSEDGATTIVRAATTFEQIARNEINEKTLASPAASGGSLYLRGEKTLYKFSPR